MPKGLRVGIRKQMDDETVFEGFIWPTEDPLTFAMSKLREDKARERGRCVALAPPLAPPLTQT